MSRKAFEVTEKDRAIVKSMASYGIPQVDIGKVIGCSHVTLRRYFADELERGMPEANAKVAKVLFECAIDKDPAYNSQRIFWLKTRAGWRDTTDHRFVDSEGKDRPLDLASARSLIRNWKPQDGKE